MSNNPSRSPKKYIADRRTWSKKIKYIALVTDIVALSISFAIAHYFKFDLTNPKIVGRQELDISYIFLSVILIAIWVIALGVAGSRSLRVFGDGKSEYNIITKVSVYIFAIVVTFSFLTEVDFARRYIVVAFPLGWLLIVGARTAVRIMVRSYRQKGRMLTSLMIIGEQRASSHMYKLLKDSPEVGLKPVAVYLSDIEAKEQIEDIEKFSELFVNIGKNPKKIINQIEKLKIQAVIITDGHGMSPESIRQLGWELALRDVALMLAPATTDIAGPRIHMTPMNGFPLIHVSTPRLDGTAGFIKRVMDIVASGFGLLLLLPLLLPIALIIKRDGGPAFYSQERIGKDGVPFRMWKFRSMVTNADELKADLIKKYGGGDALLFKMEHDPRITKIGKFIRRYSIDELPQLWNVFIGDMSLVGPRPQIQEEVNQYTESAHRRLMVSPGLTGLWQVSGRSKLTWDEALRFDLYYVENWSLVGDIAILLRTVRAVIGKDGAY